MQKRQNYWVWQKHRIWIVEQKEFPVNIRRKRKFILKESWEWAESPYRNYWLLWWPRHIYRTESEVLIRLKQQRKEGRPFWTAASCFKSSGAAGGMLNDEIKWLTDHYNGLLSLGVVDTLRWGKGCFVMINGKSFCEVNKHPKGTKRK